MDINLKKKIYVGAVAISAAILAGCGGSDDNNSTGFVSGDQGSISVEVPQTYAFTDKFGTNESAVSYPGQTKRHILINDMVSYILSLQDSADQDVFSDLNFFYQFDGSSSDGVGYLFSLGTQTLIPGPLYGDIASDKSLSGKIAGNDPALINGEFFGWESGLDTTPTPDEFVTYLFELLDSISTDESSETIQLTGGVSADIDVPYVTDTGLDLRLLIQKFLLGAVAYSQGTGDYLKADFTVNNDVPEDGTKPYSIVEHEWDEAFGYFGAARNYSEYTDQEIAGSGGRAEYAEGYNDANGDGIIDITSEVNFGHAVNCAKRDNGATVATDYTKTAFDAFLRGRAILNDTTENLDAEAHEELQNAAVTASQAWEACIAATVVHYINDSIADIDAFQDDGYTSLDAFKNYAKHWAEMKGFALSLQFNPDSVFRVNTASLTQLKNALELMGDAPVQPDGTQNRTPFAGGVDTYRANLLQARAIFENMYDFAPENVANW